MNYNLTAALGETEVFGQSVAVDAGRCSHHHSVELDEHASIAEIVREREASAVVPDALPDGGIPVLPGEFYQLPLNDDWIFEGKPGITTVRPPVAGAPGRPVGQARRTHPHKTIYTAPVSSLKPPSGDSLAVRCTSRSEFTRESPNLSTIYHSKQTIYGSIPQNSHHRTATLKPEDDRYVRRRFSQLRPGRHNRFRRPFEPSRLPDPPFRHPLYRECRTNQPDNPPGKASSRRI
jgi:hypothetical protein